MNFRAERLAEAQAETVNNTHGESPIDVAKAYLVRGSRGLGPQSPALPPTLEDATGSTQAGSGTLADTISRSAPFPGPVLVGSASVVLAVDLSWSIPEEVALFLVPSKGDNNE